MARETQFDSGSSAGRSPLELFLEFLDSPAANDPGAFEALCGRHPAVADRLREIWADFSNSPGVGERLSPSTFATVVGALESPPISSGGARYEIGMEIGRGGMGVVYSARDVEIGRPVALKFLQDRWQTNPDFVARFEAEARLAGALQHPGIAPVYEVVHERGRPCFAMKLIEGRTLGEAMRNWPEGDLLGLLRLFESVCQTIAYVHSHDVVHRDLKPGNVMIGKFGEVQVVDWGMAKVLPPGRGAAVDLQPPDDPGHGGDDEEQTLGGGRHGTPAYMSPEQAKAGGTVDQRSDVFALGAILCEILTGRPPYVTGNSAGDESADLLEMAAAARLGPAAERLRAGSVPAELVELCLDCLAPQPRDRPRNAGVIARRIDDYIAQVGARTQRAEIQAVAAKARAEGFRRFSWLLVIALVGAVLLLLATWVNWQRAEELKWRSQLDAGQSSAGLGQVADAEKHLWALDHDDGANRRVRWALRGLYARNPVIASWQAHDGPVSVIAATADGKAFVTGWRRGHDDAELRAWRVAYAGPRVELIRTWRESRQLNDVELTADGAAAVASFGDGAVIEFPLAKSGSRTIHSAGGGGEVSRVHLWEGERTIVARRADGQIELWDRFRLGAPRVVLSIPRSVAHIAHRGYLWVLAQGGRLWRCSPDTHALVAGDGAGALAFARFVPAPTDDLWVGALRTGTNEYRLTKAALAAPEVGEDAAWGLRLGRRTGAIVAAGSFFFTTSQHRLAAVALYHLDPDERRSGGAADPEKTFHTPAPIARIISLPNVPAVATALSTGEVRVWRAAVRTRLPGTVQSLAWTRDGSAVLAAWGEAASGGVQRIARGELATDAGQGIASPRSKQVSWVAVHPRLPIAACSDRQGRIEIVGLGGAERFWLDWREQEVSHMAFDAPGGQLCVAHNGGVTLFRTADWQVTRELEIAAGAVKRVAFVGDHRIFACGVAESSGAARHGGWLLWDTTSEDVPSSWSATTLTPLRSMAKSASGLIAAGSDDGSIDIRRVDGTLVGEPLSGHAGAVFALAFRPGAPQVLASADSLGEVRLWNVATGDLLCVLRDRMTEPFRGVFSLAFAPDGMTLAAGGERQYVSHWDFAELDRMVDANRACRARQRRGR